MTLTHDGTRFVFRGSFAEKEYPKSARFRWSPEDKVWWTDDPERAAKLQPIADQVSAIHECLRILAGLDPDHAFQRNGVGYNSADGPIGHSLAERGVLTPRQAALGLKIVAKYHRQLGEDILTKAKGEDVKI